MRVNTRSNFPLVWTGGYSSFGAGPTSSISYHDERPTPGKLTFGEREKLAVVLIQHIGGFGGIILRSHLGQLMNAATFSSSAYLLCVPEK